MLTRLNYTRRKRIKKKDVEVAVNVYEDKPATFTAVLKLQTYQLPPDGRVFLEAYRRSTWKRFDFGSIEDLSTPTDTSLEVFPDGSAVLFRVKVVAPPGDSPDQATATLLAQAESIRPKILDNRQQRRESLLPISPGERRDEVWWLEFAEDGEPLLKISEQRVEDRHALVQSDAFSTLVFPQILRSILTRILLIDRFERDTEDPGNWRALWLEFASSLPMVGPEPATRDDYGAEDEDWIEQAVEGFARRISIGGRFETWWQGEAG